MPTKITTLTDAQWTAMARWREEAYAIGAATGPTDRVDAREAITALYAAIGKPAPQFLFLPSPASAMMAYGLFQLQGQLWSQIVGDLKAQLRDPLADQLGSQLRNQVGERLVGQLADQLRFQLSDQLGSQLRNQLAGQLADQLGSQLRNQLAGQLVDQPVGQLGGQLRSQLMDQVWDQLGDQLSSQLRSQLRSQLEGHLGSQLWDQLSRQLGGQLWGQLGDQFREILMYCFYGQYETHWITLYTFAATIGVAYTPWQDALLRLWDTQARACGWSFPYEKLCLVSDRPSVLCVDAQRRLHAEAGPALAFSDGYALWAWHGVRVSQQVIEHPDRLTVDAIQAESNTERRRVMIERWGWERYLDASEASLVDVDTEPAGVPGLRGLYRCHAGPEVVQVLVCCCASTGRTYALEVPPEVHSCTQAANWLAQTDQLHLLVRT